MNLVVENFLTISEHARLDADELKKIYPESVFIESKETNTQGFMFIRGTQLIISFRGTQQLPDWFNDFNGWHVTYPYGNKNSDIKVHKGFIECYRSVRGQILEYISKHKKDLHHIVVCGHSLGGALATLCAVDVQYNHPDITISCYPSGNPAVGNKAFVRSYNKRVPDTTRTYMRRDIVPKCPPKWFGLKLYGGYAHTDKPNPIGKKGFWDGLKMYFKIRKDLAGCLFNHNIDLYKKWC